ncbi:MAG: hypothetical protein ACLQHF_12980 [Terracidiphilus sp.]
MINVHAICHEAGHAIVAMRFGIRILGISVENSIPTIRLDTGGAPLEKVCAVYAAGVAAERIAFGGNNPTAAEGDQRQIEVVEGGKLEDYLSDATRIIQDEIKCHKQLRMAMTANWADEEGSSEWHGAESDKMNQPLLDAAQIMAIWESCHPN